jgi:3-(3-hydroxy-phenyl)propionate hydroxylase
MAAYASRACFRRFDGSWKTRAPNRKTVSPMVCLFAAQSAAGCSAVACVRAADGRIELSDETLGNALTLIGFGIDIVLEPETLAAFGAAGGRVVRLCHRGQALHLSAHDAVWEDIDGSFLPRMVPCGWAAVVRPDRVVLHGPAADACRLVHESLRILGIPDQLAAPRQQPAAL